MQCNANTSRSLTNSLQYLFQLISHCSCLRRLSFIKGLFYNYCQGKNSMACNLRDHGAQALPRDTVHIWGFTGALDTIMGVQSSLDKSQQCKFSCKHGDSSEHSGLSTIGRLRLYLSEHFLIKSKVKFLWIPYLQKLHAKGVPSV